MAVEPKKAEARADERRADDRELAGEGIKRDLQILRDAENSRGVGEQRVSESDRDRATDRETVETVREIDRVRRADDDEREKEEGKHAHVHDHRHLEKGKVKRARLHLDQRIEEKKCGHDSGECDLENELQPSADPVGFFLRDLQVVIHETERAEVDHAEEDKPDEWVIRVAPRRPTRSRPSR